MKKKSSMKGILKAVWKKNKEGTLNQQQKD